jgi:hypothetical protein
MPVSSASQSKGCLSTRPAKLVPPSLLSRDGTGTAIDLGNGRPELLIISMGINHVLENERLSVSIWGSADGSEWGEKPLACFPPKGYCGIYSLFLKLAEHPDVRYLRASWNMSRNEKGRGEPLFGFYVSTQASSAS